MLKCLICIFTDGEKVIAKEFKSFFGKMNCLKKAAEFQEINKLACISMKYA